MFFAFYCPESFLDGKIPQEYQTLKFDNIRPKIQKYKHQWKYYENINTEKTHKIVNGDICTYYVKDTQKDQVCSHVCTTGNKVTLIYPKKRAAYNFVNVNLDVADDFNVHIDVETKHRQKEMSSSICYQMTFICFEQ